MRAVLKLHEQKVYDTLVALLSCDSHTARLGACKEILERLYGPATAPDAGELTPAEGIELCQELLRRYGLPA